MAPETIAIALAALAVAALGAALYAFIAFRRAKRELSKPSKRRRPSAPRIAITAAYLFAVLFLAAKILTDPGFFTAAVQNNFGALQDVAAAGKENLLPLLALLSFCMLALLALKLKGKKEEKKAEE